MRRGVAALVLFVVVGGAVAVLHEHLVAVVVVLSAGALAFGLCLLTYGTVLNELGKSVVVAIPVGALLWDAQQNVERHQKELEDRLSLELQGSLRGADLRGKHLSDIRLSGKDLR